MKEKTDRRVRKTKAALRAGLMKLMQTKSIREITIRELVEEVDINRSTFYLHYTDIYDMLNKIEQELLDQIIEVTVKHKTEYSPAEIVEVLQEIFQILLENMDICHLLMSPNGDINFITQVKNLIRDNITTATIELFQGQLPVDQIEYACSFCIYGCIGIIEKWLMDGAVESPEKLAQLCDKLICNGIITYLPDNQ